MIKKLLLFIIFILAPLGGFLTYLVTTTNVPEVAQLSQALHGRIFYMTYTYDDWRFTYHELRVLDLDRDFDRLVAEFAPERSRPYSISPEGDKLAFFRKQLLPIYLDLRRGAYGFVQETEIQ